MLKTVRFCINCGREIGDAYFCPNPDCGGLPSFYRDVPGPEKKTSSSLLEEQEPERPTAPGAGGPAKPDLERRTMPLLLSPVALLRSVAAPVQEHPLWPGANEVGARRPAKVVIDRPEVSSSHAVIQIERRGDAWEAVVRDRDSTNGTFLNGVRVKEGRLADGDEVRFAAVEFQFRLVLEEAGRVTIRL